MDHDVVRFYQFGQPEDVLQVERRPILALGQGEVRVRMLARPINPSDLIPIRGAYSHRISLPGIPGYEGVGIVEEVGAGVSSAWIGKRVLPLRGEGTWQELVKTSLEWAVPVPGALDVETASQLYINPLTAWVVCTEALKLQEEDVLVVNAGGSAIGRIFAQLSKVLGFRLIAAVRSGAHREELLALGAWQVVDTSAVSLREAVWDATGGRKAAAAIDSIGGADGEMLMQCVRPGGKLVSIGLLSGRPVNWGELAKQTGVGVQLFWLRHWNASVSSREWQGTFETVLNLVERDQVKMMAAGQRFDLREVAAAVRAAVAPGQRGKVLLARKLDP